MDIWIIVLMGILFVAQFALTYRQLKKKTPDSKILLIVNCSVFVIWTTLTVIKRITGNLWVSVSWFIVTFLYMIFILWYTNMLSKSLKK